MAWRARFLQKNVEKSGTITMNENKSIKYKKFQNSNIILFGFQTKRRCLIFWSFWQKYRSSRLVRLNQNYPVIAEVKSYMCIKKTSLDMLLCTVQRWFSEIFIFEALLAIDYCSRLRPWFDDPMGANESAGFISCPILKFSKFFKIFKVQSQVIWIRNHLRDLELKWQSCHALLLG